jgi:hypothetical protein
MAAGDGLVIMTPTSIAHSGTSASINSDGGVDFTSVTSLSLNGVFTSSFDNYLIVYRGIASVNDSGIRFRLRVSGTDNTTANSYTQQFVYADGSTTAASRLSADYANQVLHSSSTREGGGHLHLYGPFLTQPTAARSVVVSGFGSAYLQDSAVTHNQSTSYDGITFFPPSGNFTGNIVVFGYEE